MASLQNVVLYGAGGQNIGQAILSALISDGSFNISVLARKSSKTVYPASVKLLHVSDDLPHAELVALLKGQDAVISAVGPDGVLSQPQIIDAAIEAGVRRFIPSEYGFDNADPKSLELSPIFWQKGEIETYLRQKVAQHPEFSWTAVATGIWAEWTLPVKFLGVDPVAHTVTYWDGGNHKYSNSTLPYSGLATARALKHPELVKNKRIFLEAFTASQRDTVAELERQQGVKYTEIEPTVGAQIVKAAQAQLKASNNTDLKAAFANVGAQVLMKEYGADFRAAGKAPIFEDLVEMPKVTLEDAIRMFVSGQ